MVRNGRNALGQGRYDEAIADFREAAAKLGGVKTVGRDLASAHRAKAAMLIQQGKCQAASEEIGQADLVSPPNLRDHQALYRCIISTPSTPILKRTVLKRLYDIGERHGPILRALTLALLDHGDTNEAFKVAAVAARRYAFHGQDFRRLGLAYAAAGQNTLALNQLKQFLRHVPTDPLIRLKTAELREALGQKKRALQTYQALTKDFPKNPVVFLRLAAFCKRNADPYCAARATARANEIRGLKRQIRDLRPLIKSKR